MLCLLLVFALVSPYSFTLAQDGNKAALVHCNDTESQNQANEVYNCVSTVIDHSTSDSENCLQNVPKMLHNYLIHANKSCYKVKSFQETEDLIRLAIFSIRNDKYNYRDFVDKSTTNGPHCLTTVKQNITECVKINTGEVANSDKYYKLWKEINPIMNLHSARRALKVKECVISAIRNEGYVQCNFGFKVMDYVGSLFDYMIERAKSQDVLPPAVSPPNKRKPKVNGATKTTHALLGLLLALALIGFCYVIIRDCRAPNGQWKSLKEQFAMKQRRRSLVHNEAGREE